MHPTLQVLERIDRRSRNTLLAWSLIATVAIAILDLVAGENISLRYLYALPVVILTLAFGATGGVLAAAASLVLSATIYAVASDESHDWMSMLVNLAVRFVVLAAVAVIIADLADLAAQNAYLARHDQLTGVLTRAGFIDALDQERVRCAASRHPLVLLHVDLNRFKLLSSEHTDLSGDEVLARSAAILISATGDPDRIGRLGGDEFIVMLPEADIPAANEVARQIRRAALAWAGDAARLGPNIGIALFSQMPESTDQLIDTADALVYDAFESDG